MTRVARIVTEDREPAGRSTDDGAAARRARANYYAFLSYSHKDEELAEWLHEELEQFRVPPALAGRITGNGVIPRKLAPIFRDKQELAAATDLGAEIRGALAASQFLVVLCSPSAAASRWTNAEIEAFKRGRPDGCVLAVIAAGEPFASDIPGREAEECFPPALRERYDKRGRPTGKRAEPIAADMRGGADERRLGFLKLVAGMLGVGLDDLVQRETTRRHRRMAWLSAASLAGMVVTSFLAITAIQARDAARDQRREAESLVAFMLGDLKDKLEPIGKIDVLDGVGTKVLDYYRGQDTSELSDAGLLQRSRALSLIAQGAYKHENFESARRLYREAMEGTAEAIRRDPGDPQRLYDHAQNVFYLAEIALGDGDYRTAEMNLREYKKLAQKMVALGPDNMKWRMEQQYADFNLAGALYRQRRYREATAQFAEALRTIEAISAADPKNKSYGQSVAEALAWLADSNAADGRIGEAIALRQRDLALLHRLYAETRNLDYRARLIPASRALGSLYFWLGKTPEALAQYRAAVAEYEQVAAVEPNNKKWLLYGVIARLALARTLIATGDHAGAASQATLACTAIDRELARDRGSHAWLSALNDCNRKRAHIALAQGNTAQALAFAQRALAAARSIKSGDPVGDRFLVAGALRLTGDMEGKRGDGAAANQAWSNAFAALPAKVTEQPEELREHRTILQRLGRADEARLIAARLNEIGFRE